MVFVSLINSYGLHWRCISHVIFDHDLEIYIYLDALGLIHLLSLRLLLAKIIHLLSAFLSILLKSFDFLQARRFLIRCIIVIQVGVRIKVSCGLVLQIIRSIL